MTRVSSAPESSRARDRSSVELYRSIQGTYSWKINVVAEDDTEDAIREAMALAFRIDKDTFADMRAHLVERRELYPKARNVPDVTHGH